MRVALFVIILLLLAGCASKSINIYTMDLPSSVNYSISSRYKNSILKVEYPNGNSESLGSRIYYKDGDRESWYLYSRWSDSVNQMLLSIIIEALQQSAIFKDIIDYRSSSVYDYTLETTIYRFYHQIEDNNSYAYLKIGFRLLNRSNKIIKSKIFEYKIKCTQTDAKGFVEAVREINKKLSKDLVLWIAK